MGSADFSSRESSRRIFDFAKRYIKRLGLLLGGLDLQVLADIIFELERARSEGNTVFIIGNGGSASTASHMAQDLAFGTRHRKEGRLSAISLTDNASFLTASANDLGFESIFEEQLRSLLSPGDMVIAISASGNSGNLVRAVEYANSVGALTIGLLGFDGGRLKELCRIALHVATDHGEYGLVEDVHMVLDHLIMTYLMSIDQGNHAE